MPRLSFPLAMIAALAILAAPTLAQSQFEGRYHWHIDNCGDDMTLEVRGDRIGQRGATCRLTQPTNIRGLQAQAFDMICPLEGGGTGSERVILSFDAEGGLLIVRNAGYESHVRCR